MTEMMMPDNADTAARCYKADGLNGSGSWQWKEPQTPVCIVRPGDRVQLGWYGDSGVPQWLHQSWATVIRCNRKRIVVDPDRAATATWAILPERHVLAVKHVNLQHNDGTKA